MEETLEFEIVTDPTEASTEPVQVVETEAEQSEATETTTPVYTESLDATEATEMTETVEVVDYRATITESTSVLANIILCAALMIVGVLVAFRFWEAQ